MKKRILVVDDEEKLRRVIELHLLSAGFDVDKARSAEEALKLADRADMVITNLRLPSMDGLQLLSLIRRQNAQAPVVVMTAFGTVENAVEAMKSGATDFLLKPFSLDHLTAVVQKALEVRALRDENRQLKEELGRRYEFDKITCTALPESLMESELFGYEKGAFTGAAQTKPGKFEQADSGTVLLDEIGDVPASIQVKLLRVLQEREIERLGSNKTLHIDVRVIAATNSDLRAALEQGTFREDLYYRLNVVPISIPPLRARREDIQFLAEHFVRTFGADNASPVQSITEAAIKKLTEYHWPGNVRELQNVIERSLVLCSGTTLDAGDIKLETAPRPRAQTGEHLLPDGMTLDEYKQSIIREALQRAEGNKSQAARLLGLSRNALRYRLTQMGLEG